MATCPAGHDSATDDYCDTCGLVMAPAAPSPPPPPPPSNAQVCVVCGAERLGRFCEDCGHDSALPAPPERLMGAPPPDERAIEEVPRHGPPVDDPGPTSGPQRAGGWAVVVSADREWFEEVRRRDGPDVATVEFPRYCPERRFPLTGRQLAIGRRSRSRGTNPEIDLSGPPLDPGVSAQHALLVARSDGGWDLVDLNSTNGTSLGDSADPVAANTPVALEAGDRIRLGAWTTITVERA